jgi:hypothetical protein
MGIELDHKESSFKVHSETKKKRSVWFVFLFVLHRLEPLQKLSTNADQFDTTRVKKIEHKPKM